MREDHNREIIQLQACLSLSANNFLGHKDDFLLSSKVINLQASIEREKNVAAKEASAAEERRMQDIDALEMQNRDATNEVL